MDSIVVEDVAILKCPICLDIFDKPKLLSCGHTLCAKCTDQLYVSSREQRTPCVCPECRRNVDIPDGATESLPPNFVIQRLLDDGRRRPNNAANTRAQADDDIDGLTRLVFQLKQTEKSSEERRTKLIDAVRQKEAVIQQTADHLKRCIDVEVGKLLERLYAFRDCHLTKITASRERVQAKLDTAYRFCSWYGDLRRSDMTSRVTEEWLSRSHDLTEELLQCDVNHDDFRVPSLVFRPSTAGFVHKNLVGQLDEVNDTKSTGQLCICMTVSVLMMRELYMPFRPIPGPYVAGT